MLNQLLAKKPPTTDHSLANALQLDRTLGPWGLTCLGIGAIIGGGIFVITGQAAAIYAGPAVVISFVIAALCCTFCALAYAEFAAMVPMSGSAYSYAYATFGEGVAWFVGWMLILEYAVSASAVAISWTGYFVSLLKHLHLALPDALLNAPLDNQLHATGSIANVPAAAMVLMLTAVCYVGIQKSSAMNVVMVLLKSSLIVLFIIVGYQYIQPAHWHPFIPPHMGQNHFGWQGVVHGAAMVFFAYIGFEAVSVAAQESKHPQRDLPFGMIASLLICTILYVGVAFVLTGLVPYSQLNHNDPLVAAITPYPQLLWLRVVVEIGALIGLASVVLVMIIGQPRIFMVMSADGLLPPLFQRIHPKFRTPHLNTLLTGIGIASLAAIFPLDILGDLTSMGTLIAFVVVCAGVLILRRTQPQLPRPFRVPCVGPVCLAGIASCFTLMVSMSVKNWLLMMIWSLLGFAIYFCYGYRHSQLRLQAQRTGLRPGLTQGN